MVSLEKLPKQSGFQLSRGNSIRRAASFCSVGEYKSQGFALFCHRIIRFLTQLRPSFLSLPTTLTENCKMALRFTLTLLLVTILVAAILLGSSEAAYRKPPFNGSIFGKRNSLGKSKIRIPLKPPPISPSRLRQRQNERRLRGGHGGVSHVVSPERQQIGPRPATPPPRTDLEPTTNTPATGGQMLCLLVRLNVEMPDVKKVMYKIYNVSRAYRYIELMPYIYIKYSINLQH